MTRTAIFVIDIQKEMAGDIGTDIPHAQRIRDAGTEILVRTRKHIKAQQDRSAVPDLSIIFVQHEEDADSGGLIRGSEKWELVFKPEDGERMVSKTTGSTFESNTSLAEELKKNGIMSIVTFGIQSEMCVRSTSIGALEAGFEVTLLSGAHSTYDTKERAAEQIESDVEEELKGRGASVREWSEWLKGVEEC